MNAVRDNSVKKSRFARLLPPDFFQKNESPSLNKPKNHSLKKECLLKKPFVLKKEMLNENELKNIELETCERVIEVRKVVQKVEEAKCRRSMQLGKSLKKLDYIRQGEEQQMNKERGKQEELKMRYLHIYEKQVQRKLNIKRQISDEEKTMCHSKQTEATSTTPRPRSLTQKSNTLRPPFLFDSSNRVEFKRKSLSRPQSRKQDFVDINVGFDGMLTFSVKS